VSDDSLVRVSRAEGVLTLQLRRPAKKNALTTGMYSALASALNAAASDLEIRVACLSGEGGAFTAGNDLGQFLDATPAGLQPVSDFLNALHDFPKPLVAAVNGLAIGVGTTLLLHCDHVVATSSAAFRMPFVDLGLMPEAASSVLVTLFGGMRFAQKTLLLGLPFTADEALAAGIVSEVVQPEQLEARTAEVCKQLALKPVRALMATKSALRAPWRALTTAAMASELKGFSELLASEEARAIMNEILTKRAPTA